MLIILEGPDGVGKTTLAKQLHDAIRTEHESDPIVMMHKGPPTQHPLDEYLTPLLNYRPGSSKHFILDRWHWGEYVYPRLTGRPTDLDDACWWYINQYVRRLGGVVVLCERSRSGVQNTYLERGEGITAVEYEQAVKLFAMASHTARTVQVRYGWEPNYRVGLDCNVAEIIRTAQLWESYTAPLARYVTYIGAVAPKYLVLGDVRHGLDRVEQIVTRTDHRPAFMPYRGTSGHWLLTALTEDKALRASTALANARDVDDVYALWRDLGRPKVVTLGQLAHRELEPYDIPHGRAPHPQFGRRFHHHNQSSYISAVYAAAERQEDHSSWRGSSLEEREQRSTPRSSTRLGAEAVGVTRATDLPMS